MIETEQNYFVDKITDDDIDKLKIAHPTQFAVLELIAMGKSSRKDIAKVLKKSHVAIIYSLNNMVESYRELEIQFFNRIDAAIDLFRDNPDLTYNQVAESVGYSGRNKGSNLYKSIKGRVHDRVGVLFNKVK